MGTDPPLARLEAVGHGYPKTGSPLFGAKALKTVLSDVDLSIGAGSVVGLVGESGSGKSTLSRLAAGLETPRSGRVLYRGAPGPKPLSKPWRESRRRIQMIFQDPYASLDRRMAILDQVAEPLLMHRLASRPEALERARAALEAAAFPRDHLLSKPPTLSGGQLQRAVIARAVILSPELLVCDEPLSSLDATIRAQIMALLENLRRERGLTMLLVSHDLAVAARLSDVLAVMLQGRLVETGPAAEVRGAPAHPYTRLLLDSVPGAKGPGPEEVPELKGGPSGCPFHGRCPRRRPRCREAAPRMESRSGDRTVACHFPGA